MKFGERRASISARDMHDTSVPAALGCCPSPHVPRPITEAAYHRDLSKIPRRKQRELRSSELVICSHYGWLILREYPTFVFICFVSCSQHVGRRHFPSYRPPFTHSWRRFSFVLHTTPQTCHLNSIYDGVLPKPPKFSHRSAIHNSTSRSLISSLAIPQRFGSHGGSETQRSWPNPDRLMTTQYAWAQSLYATAFPCQPRRSHRECFGILTPFSVLAFASPRTLFLMECFCFCFYLIPDRIPPRSAWLVGRQERDVIHGGNRTLYRKDIVYGRT